MSLTVFCFLHSLVFLIGWVALGFHAAALLLSLEGKIAQWDKIYCLVIHLVVYIMHVSVALLLQRHVFIKYTFSCYHKLYWSLLALPTSTIDIYDSPNNQIYSCKLLQMCIIGRYNGYNMLLQNLLFSGNVCMVYLIIMIWSWFPNTLVVGQLNQVDDDNHESVDITIMHVVVKCSAT